MERSSGFKCAVCLVEANLRFIRAARHRDVLTVADAGPAAAVDARAGRPPDDETPSPTPTLAPAYRVQAQH